MEQTLEQTLEQAAEIEEQDQERRDETESPSLLSSQDIGTGGYPQKKSPLEITLVRHYTFGNLI